MSIQEVFPMLREVDAPANPLSHDLDGDRVDVYRNLHADDDTESVSIVSRDPKSPDYGNVVGHCQTIIIENPEFVVQESGQEKVRETGVKNPHAFVRGRVDGIDMDAQIEWGLLGRLTSNAFGRATYDPYEDNGFKLTMITSTKGPYSRGDLVDGDDVEFARVSKKGVYIIFSTFDGD